MILGAPYIYVYGGTLLEVRCGDRRVSFDLSPGFFRPWPRLPDRGCFNTPGLWIV